MAYSITRRAAIQFLAGVFATPALAGEIPQSEPYLFSGYSLDQVARFLVSKTPQEILSSDILSALRLYKTRNPYNFSNLGEKVSVLIAQDMEAVIDAIYDDVDKGNEDGARRVAKENNLNLADVLITMRSGGADGPELQSILADYKVHVVLPEARKRAEAYVHIVNLIAAPIIEAKPLNYQTFSYS